MQLNFDVLNRITFLTGSAEIAQQLLDVVAIVPFEESIVEFLNHVSKILMKNPESKAFTDVITFAFWIRKSSVLQLKERFEKKDVIQLGKGVVFHIAPSNVPVNFAYSLAVGLMMGNANVVRVPSKDFPQVRIITKAFEDAIKEYSQFEAYVLCVRYGHDKEINDFFSSIADQRVVWGGNKTIAELRQSPLPPRSGEVTFADRYSLAVINSDTYLLMQDKGKVAEDFYNDTFLTDQNACTSPRLVVWMGSKIEEAKNIFWSQLHKLVKQRYGFQPIQGVNKLAQYFSIAISRDVKVEPHQDNLIIRVSIPEIWPDLMDFRGDSGYFYEYDCQNILDIVPITKNKQCQTISYIGDKNIFLPLFQSGIRGIDRIVPVGKSMDFDLIWDGYNLPEYLSRSIVV